MKKLISGVCVAACFAAVGTMMVSANPAVGVTPTLLAVGTYKNFKVKTQWTGAAPFKFEAEAESKADSPYAANLVVRQHDYEIGGSTGWHSHPGPVFITVTKGTLTFYEYDNPCTGHPVSAGQGYVDTGHGHIAINHGTEPATDVSVIVAPVGGSFRGEIDPVDIPGIEDCPTVQ
jgi:quercetin dioxygenase-like cupin family protein